MKKRVLITGATGFVGRQVFKYLATNDVNLKVIVRHDKQLLFTDYSAVESVIVTPNLFAETTEWWKNVLQDVDTVIHVAWYTEPGLYLNSSINIDCLQGTLNMAKGAALAGVKRFVGIGTCFEYDLRNGIVSIDTPINPLTPYAAAKAAAYMTLSQWFHVHEIEFLWCRLFYLYGEGEDSRRLVPYLREKLSNGEPVELTSGEKIRDFINVSEAGRLIAEASMGKIQGPINICSGIAVTVKQLAEKIANEYGRNDLLRFGIHPDNFFDPKCVVGIKCEQLS